MQNPNKNSYSQDNSSLSETSIAPPTHRSLLAVVEIRDIDNEPVEAEGELSLMVMSAPASQSLASTTINRKPQRLQRWDFSAEEINQAWQSSSLGDGLHLELPLAILPFPQESLELWARLVTVDGQKYLTKLPFHPQHLVAWQDGPLTTPEYDVTLTTKRATRLTDTIPVDMPWQLERNLPGHPLSDPIPTRAGDRLQPTHHRTTLAPTPIQTAPIQTTAPVQTAPIQITQWHTAKIQPLRFGHNTVVTSKSPRWVAQAAADPLPIRNLKASP